MVPMFLAALVALVSAAASLRRILFVVHATALDPSLVLERLRGERGRQQAPAVLALFAAQQEGSFERELADALAGPEAARPILVAQAETEFGWTLRRWDRVPRVCASISSSCAFLLASMVLRNGLTFEEGTYPNFNGLVFRAMGVVVLGLAGTSAAIAAQRIATAAVRRRRAAVTALVDRLEECLEASETAENSA